MFEQIINRKYSFTPDYYARSARVLDTALNQVRVYRAWKSYDPGAAAALEDRYAALPALTKKDIREHFPYDMLPAGLDFERAVASGEIDLVESSGTIDDKITNIWNQTWWDASERASWKYNSAVSRVATGDHPEAILVNPKNVGILSDNIDLPMGKRRLGRYLYLNEKSDPLAWSTALMDRMINELNTFRPAVLEANPSYLARLCRYISAHGKDVFQPGVITFTYEYPIQLHYRSIRRVFSSPLASSYGTTETGYVFMQCEQGFYHQNSEFCRVDFQPFKPEHGGCQLGRILVTPFNNPWSYLIRFDPGDIVQLEASGKCACGRNSGLVLSSLAGRKINLTLTCAGRLVTLMELDQTVSRLAGIEQYRLVQSDLHAYELTLVSTRTDREKLSAEAIALLKDLYGRQADIAVNYEPDLPPESSGKYLISRTLFPIDLDNYLDR
jgi:phenylacetate-coenzyme A ligase PaaK-like adenylate-forming protein